MQLILVSGRSGSGKTVALRALEDLGFYCVDNLPITLLPTLMHALGGAYESVAVSVDVRNLPADAEELTESLDFLPDDVKFDILYVDTDDGTLLRRYAETRRMHPLSRQQRTLPEAIEVERQLLRPLADQASWRIDSTHLSVHELSEQVTERVLGRKQDKLLVVLMSFGFKYGLPENADTVFDARILPNPHWHPELKPYTGKDAPVQKFLQAEPLVNKFVSQVGTFLDTWLPYFQRSNRSYLTIGIGCTGGQHRSVYITEELASLLRERQPHLKVVHRELEARS